MILKSLENFNNLNIPIIIFGSGPAGVSLALELEKFKIKSVIIEAGKKDYDEDSQKFYEGTVVGDTSVDLSGSRLRQFGGTSGHWGGWSKPLEEYDYKNWPIKQKDTFRFQQSTCEILNIRNQFRNSTLNKSLNQIEFQYSKVRFAEKYYDHIKDSNNIFLVLDTQLSHFEGNNRNTKFAICISKNNTYQLKSKYFILCCGGVENSRILLWSKEKNNNFINNDLPIGKYWMSHPWIVSGKGIIFKEQLKKKMSDKYVDYEDILHFASKKKLIEHNSILGGAIYMRADEDTKFYKEIIKDLLCTAPDLGKKISKEILYKDLKCGNIFMNLEEKAEEENKITLDYKKKDALNIPQPVLFYKKNVATIHSAKKIMEEFANFCRENDIGRIAIAKEIFNLEGYNNLGVNHHIGGTRMGKIRKNWL